MWAGSFVVHLLFEGLYQKHFFMLEGFLLHSDTENTLRLYFFLEIDKIMSVLQQEVYKN